MPGVLVTQDPLANAYACREALKSYGERRVFWEWVVPNSHLEISEKGGMGFYVFESVSHNQDGQEVVRGTWTNIVRGVS